MLVSMAFGGDLMVLVLVSVTVWAALKVLVSV